MKLLIHGVGTYGSGAAFGPAVWRHHDLLTVREGEIEFQTNKGHLRLQAGDAIWIPPHVKFWGWGEGERNTMWVIHFRNPELRLSQFADKTEAAVGLFRKGLESPLAYELMKRLDEMHLGQEKWQPDATEFFCAFLYELKKNRLKAGLTVNDWRNELANWARGRLSTGLKIEDLAERAGMSNSYFRQQFKAAHGQSAGQFLHELRLLEAETLLRQTDLNLKEISARVGYSNPVSFHRAFLQKFRVSPASYQKSVAQMI